MMKRGMLLAAVAISAVACVAQPSAVRVAQTPLFDAVPPLPPQQMASLVGPTGPPRPTGTAGIVGVVDRWASYRAFTFDNGRADVRFAERGTASEISAYLADNPSLQVALDGTTDWRTQDLSTGRVGAVRAALMDAGVPGYKIQQGTYNDQRFSRDGRVEVLLSTQ